MPSNVQPHLIQRGEDIRYYNEACATCGIPADVHRSETDPVVETLESNWGDLNRCRTFVRCTPPKPAYGDAWWENTPQFWVITAPVMLNPLGSDLNQPDARRMQGKGKIVQIISEHEIRAALATSALTKSAVRRHTASAGGYAGCVHNIITHLNVLLTDAQKRAINWHDGQSVDLAVMRVIDEWGDAIQLSAAAPKAVWQDIQTLPLRIDWFHGYSREGGVNLYCRRNGRICAVAVDTRAGTITLLEDAWPPTLKGLANSWDNPVKKVIEVEVKEQIVRLVHQNLPTIEAEVRKQLSDEMVTKITAAAIEKFTKGIY